jgi:hypothetical protein
LAVLGVRALDVADVLRALEPGHDGLHDLPELGVVRTSPVLALHEDALVLLVGEVVGDHGVGAAGLADLVVVVAQGVRADRTADEDGEDHEDEPADDCLLSMLSAPAPGARSDV